MGYVIIQESSRDISFFFLNDVILIHRALAVPLEDLNFLMCFAKKIRRKSEIHVFEKIIQR